MRLKDCVAHHIRALAVKHGLSERLRLRQHPLGCQRVKLPVLTAVAVNVTVYPNDVVIGNGSTLLRWIFVAFDPRFASAVVRSCLHSGKNCIVVMLPSTPFGIGLVHAVFDINDVHRNQMNQIRAGIDGIQPVRAAINAEVFNGNQVNDWLILNLLKVAVLAFACGKAPVHMGCTRSLYLRVLQCTNNRLEPRN